jgi:hypothetical protein
MSGKTVRSLNPHQITSQLGCPKPFMPTHPPKILPEDLVLWTHFFLWCGLSKSDGYLKVIQTDPNWHWPQKFGALYFQTNPYSQDKMTWPRNSRGRSCFRPSSTNHRQTFVSTKRTTNQRAACLVCLKCFS